MALQGTLDSFSLPDVLRLLADTGKTGRLHVEGDRGQGNVWLDGGAVVAAAADRALDDAPVDEVLFEMLRFAGGSFVFAPDDQVPAEERSEGETPSDVESALKRAGELLDEWRELEAVVPSLSHHVAIAPELTVDKVTVDAGRWKTLVALAAGLSVGDLGDKLGMGELAVSRTVSDLVELGVVVVEAPPAPAQRRQAPASRRGRSERVVRKGQDDPAPRDNGGTSPREASRPTRTNGRGREDESTGPLLIRPQPDVSPPTNGSSAPDIASAKGSAGLPRRSRSTGRRSNGRPVNVGPPPLPPGLVGNGGDAGHGPPTSPFSGVSSLSTSTGSTPAVDVSQPLGSMSQPFGSTSQPFGSMTMPPAPSSSGQGLASLPPFDNSDSARALPSSLDAGPLGPSPLPPGTGQVPVVAASTLPPDLSWAADDDEPPLAVAAAQPMSPPMGTPHISPPMGNARVENAVPHADGEMASHVAVMTPEARMAVEATVGPAGGGTGLVPAAGATPEENMQRGALLGFLSSVRA